MSPTEVNQHESGPEPVSVSEPAEGRTRDFHALKTLLMQRREELSRLIVASQEAVNDIISPSEDGESQFDYNHPTDMIQGDPDFEKHIAIGDRQKAELTLVNQAIHRLEAGDYGNCESCGEQIPAARLQALPFTKHCLRCQTKEETATQAPSDDVIEERLMNLQEREEVDRRVTH